MNTDGTRNYTTNSVRDSKNLNSRVGSWRLAELVASAGLLVWFCLFAISLATTIVHSYNRLPETDYWETVPHIARYSQFPSSVWWEQHYEHRVTFPEAVFAFDWLFLKGREILPLALICLLDLATLGILASIVFESRERRTAAGWSALFLAGVVFCWPGVAFVLAFPFSLQFVMSQFFAAASFLMLSRDRPTPAILLAIVGSFSSANGLFVWPLLITISLLRPLKVSDRLKVTGAAIVVIVCFFAGYRNLGNAHLALIVDYPEKFFGYLISYLGMPLGAAGTWFALGAGSVSIIATAGLLYWAWRTNILREPAVLVPGAILAQTIAIAFVTSLSRIPVAQPFADAIVTPGRYVNFGAHYWAALIVLAFIVASASSRISQWAMILLLSVIISSAFFQSREWIHNWMNQYALYQSATLALESGLKNDTAAQTLNYADGELVKRSLPELERRGVSMYSYPRYKQIGHPVSSIPGLVEIPRTAITSVQPVQGGFQIIGWAGPLAQQLVIADAGGIVIGLGTQPGAGAGFPIGSPVPPGLEGEAFLAYAGPTFKIFDVRLFKVK
jgi:hypothetical protein